MINRTIKLRNSTVFLEYDTETQLFDVNSSELNRINFGIEYFKDLTVKIGECEILLSYDSKTNKIDVSSKDIGDIFFKDGINVDKIWHDVGDNLEADDDGNIIHGAKGSVMGSW